MPAPLLDQILGAREFLLRELKLGLGLFELRLRLLDLLLLGDDLRLDIGDVRPGDRDLRIGLIDGDAIVALVDLGEKVPGFDMLVVRHGYVGHVAANLGGHGKAARGDEGIVGGFIVAHLEPIEHSADKGREQDDGANAC